MAHDVTVSDGAKGWMVECSCGWRHSMPRKELDQTRADLEVIQHRAQGFFADFAAETRKPHFGDMQRQWMNSLLTRAIEAKLYTPEDV